MRRIITINSNQVNKSVETKKILTEKLTNAGFEVTYEFCQDAELIISIGGDGSFLKTVHDFDFTKTPIIGINTGHLVFFPEISPNHIDSFIKSYQNNDFWNLPEKYVNIIYPECSHVLNVEGDYWEYIHDKEIEQWVLI